MDFQNSFFIKLEQLEAVDMTGKKKHKILKDKPLTVEELIKFISFWRNRMQKELQSAPAQIFPESCKIAFHEMPNVLDQYVAE